MADALVRIRWGAILVMAIFCSAARAETIRGLDHVPLAVNDLAQAEADFAKLGFVIKPGRAHTNAIRNGHLKFPNDTYVELITADKADDDITAHYREFLARGDGASAYGLAVTDTNATLATLTAAGLRAYRDGLIMFPHKSPLHTVFLSARLHAPTDRPEHYEHPNTAMRLAGVWITPVKAHTKLLDLFDVKDSAVKFCGMAGRVTRTKQFEDGFVAFVSTGNKSDVDRPIAGLTIQVRDLEVAKAVLTQNAVPFQTAPRCARRSLWIPPSAAHGTWLELTAEP